MPTLDKILLPWRVLIGSLAVATFLAAFLITAALALVAFRPSLIPKLWEDLVGDYLP